VPGGRAAWSSVRQRLHDLGLRWTPQRRTLIEVLSQADGHVTGAELVERCRELDPETTPSTVYRTLDVLEDLGLGHEIVGGPLPDLDDLGRTAARVAGHLAEHDATVDELATALDLPTAAVLAVLARLEVAGFVVQGIGRYRPAGRLATRAAALARPRGGPGPGMAA